jgi:hypothetical protein
MAAPRGMPLLGGLAMMHASCHWVTAGGEGVGCAGGDGSRRRPSSPTLNSLSPVGEVWRTHRPSSLTLQLVGVGAPALRRSAHSGGMAAGKAPPAAGRKSPTCSLSAPHVAEATPRDTANDELERGTTLRFPARGSMKTCCASIAPGWARRRGRWPGGRASGRPIGAASP